MKAILTETPLVHTEKLWTEGISSSTYDAFRITPRGDGATSDESIDLSWAHSHDYVEAYLNKGEAIQEGKVKYHLGGIYYPTSMIRSND